MEPRIQYAQTKDGVSIAFWTLGEGMPLIDMWPHAFSHIQLEWQTPEWRRWYERLAQGRMLVRYDSRGTGLSDHDVSDFSLDCHLRDLEAVVDHLGLKTFALHGFLDGGPVAIVYAASHPERVSHLVLWCSNAGGPSLRRMPEAEVEIALMDKDWVIYTETVARMAMGWSAGEEAQQAAAFMRESVTQETYRAITDVLWEVDVTGLLSQLRAPALVLCRRQTIYGVEPSRGLAAGIPDARLVVLDGQGPIAYSGDSESVLEAIDDFLGEGEEAAGKTPAAGDVHTILFTDMESSTALTQRLGDAQAQELVRSHNAIVREALKAHGGSEIKHTGDGIMASFPSASRALECAVAIQRAVAERSAVSDQASALSVHIGLNAGEPIAEEEDLFGTSVQLARRICDDAEPSEILASNVVRELAAGKGFLFADRGDVALRGFEDPVRLYEVRWRDR